MTRETCPECGADSYQTRDYANLRAANGRFRRSLDKMAIDLARANLRIMELEECEGFNTMKVRRQERAIQKLEAKLKRLGEQPYAPEQKELPRCRYRHEGMPCRRHEGHAAEHVAWTGETVYVWCHPVEEERRK